MERSGREGVRGRKKKVEIIKERDMIRSIKTSIFIFRTFIRVSH